MMSPRRLLPLLLVLAVLAGAYFVTSWRLDLKDREQQESRKLFHFQETDITEVVLQKGPEAIHLVKEGNDWRLTKPLADRADPVTLNSMVSLLAGLSRERELGEEKNLAAYGLDKPAFIVEFTAKGAKHRVAFGSRTPGDQGYYALKDQDAQVLIISAASQQTLDRPLKDLREKTLLAFSLDQVKGLKFKVGAAAVELKKTGPATWTWVGKEKVKIRADRVEALIRTLHLSRAKDFVEDAPKDLKPYGLDPKSAGEVAVILEKSREALLLGGRKNGDVYARRGAAGPVVLVEKTLPEKLQQSVGTLEDRRLWSGELAQVGQVSFGSPDKLWKTRKEKDFWNFTGPAQETFKHPAVRLEAALLTVQRLEYEKLLPAGAAPEKAAYLLELADAAGKPLFRLEEAARPERGKVEVRVTVGGKTERAVIPQGAYEQAQTILKQLTAPPQAGKAGPGRRP
ncbi:MAG: DUF4340 domain-containing protein [Deltaproteobacteria bacterium]|nr:DUF4340 domain-containing protein [Deltaproteobacteria bacterium]